MFLALIENRIALQRPAVALIIVIIGLILFVISRNRNLD